MKITMLGTGHAVVTSCYNTCYVMEDGERRLLVDGGGGISLLRQLKAAGIRWNTIHEIFVTHRHLDHITGILWMMRMLGGPLASGKMKEDVFVYGHDEVIGILDQMIRSLLPERAELIGKRIHLIEVGDREQGEMMGKPVTFFDIHSVKAKQFGFVMDDNGRKIVVCGDEPLHEECMEPAEGAEMILHEAFSLYSEREKYHPYEKQHSTVKDACETAQRLHARRLLLYHSEESDLKNRKQRYTEEGRQYYDGMLYVPDDLDVIEF